jgi:hypothetical protein
LAGEGIVSLSHFMTHEDIRAGRLQVLLAEHNNGYRQPIHAVYYRNTQLALRIQCFLDFIQRKLAAYACCSCLNATTPARRRRNFLRCLLSRSASALMTDQQKQHQGSAMRLVMFQPGPRGRDPELFLGFCRDAGRRRGGRA